MSIVQMIFDPFACRPGFVYGTPVNDTLFKLYLTCFAFPLFYIFCCQLAVVTYFKQDNIAPNRNIWRRTWRLAFSRVGAPYAILLLLIYFALNWINTGNHICVFSDHIEVQQSALSENVRYRWSDIARIEAYCNYIPAHRSDKAYWLRKLYLVTSSGNEIFFSQYPLNEQIGTGLRNALRAGVNSGWNGTIVTAPGNCINKSA